MTNDEIRDGHYRFLRRWEWHLHATLTFREPYGIDQAKHKIRNSFLGRIQKRHGKNIMFAGVMFLKSDRYTRKPHVHLLLTSNLNYPRSFFYLTGKELHELERLWPSSCKVTTAAQWNQQYIAR